MLRKQTKKILVVMLFALTLVLTGRRETGKSGQQFCNSAVERCYAE